MRAQVREGNLVATADQRAPFENHEGCGSLSYGRAGINQRWASPPDDFRSLWNINNNTAGQALIIQDISKFKGGVDLGHAATAWQTIAYELTVGSMTVGQAVTQGNQTMQQLGDPERWTVIGDNSVKIAN
jgi:hypothetical protein